MIERTQDRDTVDLVCWRHYGRTSGGIVEQVFAANPGLADYGPILPLGVAIELPAPAPAARTAVVHLWD